MTPEDRHTLETALERHLRRGEVSAATDALESLCAAFPDEPELLARKKELSHPMHRAELLAAAGRYKEAITIYRELLAQRPDWDLVKERLAELFHLAQVAAPHRPAMDRKGVLEHLLERISTRRRA